MVCVHLVGCIIRTYHDARSPERQIRQWKQTKETYKYRKTREKLYKTNAAIWCNKLCREKQVTATSTPVWHVQLLCVQWKIPDDGQRNCPKHGDIYSKIIWEIKASYLLTPWCRVLLEKLTGLQLVKKFPAFQGTPRFITALTSVRHLSLSWSSPIQSIYPHPTSWRSILILSTHLRLGLPSGLFPSGFPTKTLYTPLSSPIRATCPAHLIHPHDIGRGLQIEIKASTWFYCKKMPGNRLSWRILELEPKGTWRNT